MYGLADMLKELDSVNVIDNINSWQEAVEECFKPLLEKEYISREYIQNAIYSAKEFDFYYIIGKHLAMPHAKRDFNVFKTGISLLIVRNGVNFENHFNNPIYCLIGLAAVDNDSHIDIISDILEIFGSEEDGVVASELKNMNSKKEIIDYIINKKSN
ncbi:PTS sugar transporter subunit IIA [Brachyspira pilosicoli]|uniref:PTS sugar transporter subunit IIA n=1 Tax=Brachyspira pilosicoli TaxID=52584 RepID=UPI003004A251